MRIPIHAYLLAGILGIYISRAGNAAPQIRGLSAYAAGPGSTLVISGSGFGNTAGYIVLSGLRIPAASWSPTQVSVVIPSDACTGWLYLRDAGGTASNKIWTKVNWLLPSGQLGPANLRLSDT